MASVAAILRSRRQKQQSCVTVSRKISVRNACLERRAGEGWGDRTQALQAIFTPPVAFVQKAACPSLLAVRSRGRRNQGHTAARSPSCLRGASSGKACAFRSLGNQ